MTVKITVLLENRKGKNKQLIAKPGLSLLIQEEEKTILFDSGPDSSFKYNAKRIQIDLSGLDMVILSHGHYDHCGGVPSLPDNTKILCHPAIGNERWATISCLGYKKKIKQLSSKIDYSRYEMNYSTKPVQISNSLIWSGEIHVSRSRAYGILNDKVSSPDYITDESVLIYKSSKGLVIIVGCGHRGVENIIRHCQNITGIKKVYALIGGFHLRCASPHRLRKLKQFLLEQKVEKIMGCHCTGLWGRFWLQEKYSPVTGDIIILD